MCVCGGGQSLCAKESPCRTGRRDDGGHLRSYSFRNYQVRPLLHSETTPQELMVVRQDETYRRREEP